MTRRLSLLLALTLCLLPGTALAQATSVADAAGRGDLEGVKTLLKQGADVGAARGDGMTALHWAAERGDRAMAETLLAAGASVAAVTRIGHYTPLHLASRNGNAAVVRLLLKAGADAKATTSTTGITALHAAAASGNVDAVTALLDAGADVNARESELDQTPLIFAAADNHAAVITLLIQRGADPTLTTKLIDLTQRQAMDRAAAALRRRILESAAVPGQEPTPAQQQAAIQASRDMVARGRISEADMAAGARGGRGGAGAAGDPLNQEAPPAPVNARGAMTALHHAVRQGHLKAAVALLDGGAPIDQKSGEGTTPLLTALINGQFDVARMLVERGADVNMMSTGSGIAPLWAAINAQWQPRTRYPQPQEMDQQRTTYLELVTLLLDKGADPNARMRSHPWYMVYTDCGNANCGLTNITGSTAFWRAAYGLDIGAMKLLVSRGADPNIPTTAAAGRGGGFGRGFGAGAAVPGPGTAPGQAQGTAQAPGPGGFGGFGGPGGPAGADQSGLPPIPAGGPGVFAIHAAAGVEYGEGFAGNAHRHAPDAWLPALKYLVEELGMDVNARDSDGYTALHHAAARGDNEMILYLVSKGADVTAVSRRGQTTADMANGPVQRVPPFPETVALLMKLGSKNSNRCVSCAP